MTVESIQAKRWQKSEKPKDHSVRDALVEALRRIDAGEKQADHVIIIFGHIDENGVGYDCFMQAGCFNSYAQIGLAHSCANLIAQD